MSEQANSQYSPPRFRLGRSALIGLVVFAVVGAICGATGICRSEYKQGPGTEAIIICLSSGPYGLFIGLVFGVITGVIRRFLWRHRTKA
jgi:hypothetical protein